MRPIQLSRAIEDACAKFDCLELMRLLAHLLMEWKGFEPQTSRVGEGYSLVGLPLAESHSVFQRLQKREERLLVFRLAALSALHQPALRCPLWANSLEIRWGIAAPLDPTPLLVTLCCKGSGHYYL